MRYIIFQTKNSYRSIPYALLGLSPQSNPTAEQLAELGCYEFVDSAIPEHNPDLFCPIEQWTIQGTQCIRSWTFTDQDQESSWTHQRAVRDKLIAESDWTQVSDSPLSSEKKTEWAAYRQQLRNIPQTYQKAQDIVWPEKPQ